MTPEQRCDIIDKIDSIKQLEKLSAIQLQKLTDDFDEIWVKCILNTFWTDCQLEYCKEVSIVIEEQKMALDIIREAWDSIYTEDVPLPDFFDVFEVTLATDMPIEVDVEGAEHSEEQGSDTHLKERNVDKKLDTSKSISIDDEDIRKLSVVLSNIYNPEVIEIYSFGHKDFYTIKSKKNENDLLHWYEKNGKQLEKNLEKVGYSWCYVFEYEKNGNKHPCIYMYIGKDISHITVEEFTKDIMATAPKGIEYSICDDSISTIDLKQYYTSEEKFLYENSFNIVDVNDASTLNTGNYKIGKKHVRHLEKETKIAKKRGGRPSCTVIDCINGQDKEGVMDKLRESLHSLPDGPTKAKYLSDLLAQGVISKFPSWKALKDEGMIDIGSTAWNNAMSKYRK